jgi:hypothetical protein
MTYDDLPVVCREEQCCRFCRCTLPSWQEAYSLEAAEATQYISMGVRVLGNIVVVKARRGAAGVAEFERKVRKLLGYADGVELDFTFSCSAPDRADGACIEQPCCSLLMKPTCSAHGVCERASHGVK